MRQLKCLVLAGLVGGVAFAAQAQTAAKPHHAPKPAKHRADVAPTASTKQLWSDLVHGSPAQRAMEDRDNDLAGMKPIDHSKDDFFSDWRGIK